MKKRTDKNADERKRMTEWLMKNDPVYRLSRTKYGRKGKRNKMAVSMDDEAA